jgi:hypothetical protein
VTITDAVLARVTAAVPGRQVLDGQVLESPDPAGHVAVYCTEGSYERQSVSDAAPDTRWVDVTVHSFGPDRRAAQWLSSRLTDNLMNAPIAATGWQLSWFEEHHRTGPESDTDVPGRPTVLIIDQFRALFTKSTT